METVTDKRFVFSLKEIIVGVSAILSVGASWVAISNKNAAQDLKIEQLEEQLKLSTQASGSQYGEVKVILSGMQSDLTDIKLKVNSLEVKTNK